jgi:hypothetical protein
VRIMKKTKQKVKVETKKIYLDLGCGKNKKGPEWTGVDARQFEGVDLVTDLRSPWPWDDESVEEVHSSHFVEHLGAQERIHFVNELYRVLKKGGKATIITPHWASCRAYGDLTHSWPPVSEFWFYYLNKQWRADNAPHNDGYTCHFNSTWGYSISPVWSARNSDLQQFAIQHYKEAAMDMIATLIKE